LLAGEERRLTNSEQEMLQRTVSIPLSTTRSAKLPKSANWSQLKKRKHRQITGSMPGSKACWGSIQISESAMQLEPAAVKAAFLFAAGDIGPAARPTRSELLTGRQANKLLREKRQNFILFIIRHAKVD
jgi:hypothetical protein